MHRFIYQFVYGLRWLNGVYLPLSSIGGRHASLHLSKHNANVSIRHHESSIFCIPPFLGPLLFDNTDSDARDHCANERSTSPYPSPSPLHYLPRSPLQATTHLNHSIPLLSPPLNLHVRSSHRNRRLLPPEIRTHNPRAPNGQTARHNILVFVVVLSGAGVRELCQDG
jgi:hypothetical protein